VATGVTGKTKGTSGTRAFKRPALIRLGHSHPLDLTVPPTLDFSGHVSAALAVASFVRYHSVKHNERTPPNPMANVRLITARNCACDLEGSNAAPALCVHVSLRNDITIKCASFSISQTSRSRAGPRGPAVGMFVLSATGAPAAFEKGGL
jgi:hypothetical protein